MSEDFLSLSFYNHVSQKLQTWIDFYNERNNQDEVKRAFSQEALELEETLESYNQRRNTITNQIELEVVRRNHGSFWLLAQDNRGWLFPKVGSITSGNWYAVQNLFQVEGENQSHDYIKVIKPALLTTSDGHLWKLTTRGEIVLKEATDIVKISKQTPLPENQTSNTNFPAKELSVPTDTGEDIREDAAISILSKKATPYKLSPEELEKQLCHYQQQLAEQAQAKQQQQEQLETLLILVQELRERVDSLEKRLQSLESLEEENQESTQIESTISVSQQSPELQRFLDVYNSASLDNICKTFAAICLEAVLSHEGEFTIESKNKGDYWIFTQPDAKDTGWLFPKLPIISAVRQDIEWQLFECQEKQRNSDRAKIIKPAQVSRLTQNSFEQWNLEVRGELIWM
jgi:hypothetical protein